MKDYLGDIIKTSDKFCDDAYSNKWMYYAIGGLIIVTIYLFMRA
jgi:hypothetical protein